MNGLELTVLERIERKVDALDAAIRGNGEPGLKQRVSQLEDEVQAAKRVTGQARSARRRWVEAVVAPFLSAVMTGVIFWLLFGQVG